MKRDPWEDFALTVVAALLIVVGTVLGGLLYLEAIR